jgi:hypothetical protein
MILFITTAVKTSNLRGLPVHPSKFIRFIFWELCKGQRTLPKSDVAVKTKGKLTEPIATNTIGARREQLNYRLDMTIC